MPTIALAKKPLILSGLRNEEDSLSVLRIMDFIVSMIIFFSDAQLIKLQKAVKNCRQDLSKLSVNLRLV